MISLNAATAASLLLGLVLILRGILSRQRGDTHPRCRRCRYDLFGLPDKPQRCPECGALLAEPRAIVSGLRRLRPLSLAAGIVFLMLGAALIVPVVRVTLREFDGTPYKPVWWLNFDLGDSRRVARSADELLWRLEHNRLSSVTATINRILGLQADPKRQWSDAAGDFVVEARAKGLVSDADWDRFVRPTLLLEHSAPLSRSGIGPLAVRTTRGPRNGTWEISVTRLSWQIQGHPETQIGDARSETGRRTQIPGVLRPSVHVPTAWQARLAGTSQPVVVDVEYRIALVPDRRAAIGAMDSMEWTGSSQYRAGTSFPSPAPAKTTTEGADAWLKSVRIRANDAQGVVHSISIEDGRPVFSFTADSPPADLALLVLLVDAQGNQWPVMDLRRPRGERLSVLLYGPGNQWIGSDGSSTTVRIEYNPFLTQRIPLTGPFLDGAIEIPNVAIHRQRRVPDPSTPK